MKSLFFSGDHEQGLLEGSRQARLAISRGQVAVIPTDTNFSLVADPFDPGALDALRNAKGMSEKAPLSVFVPDFETLAALVATVTKDVRALIEHFWPGPLTLIMATGDSIAWNLGQTSGTVALRMPKNNIALNLLRETGPLAQSGACKTGAKYPKSEATLNKTFNGAASVIVGAGMEKPAYQPSTVVDVTRLSAPKNKFKLVREGIISRKTMSSIIGHERFA